MPIKETRESIEAELAENQRDRIIRKLRCVAQDLEEVENHLQELEAQVGLPRFYRSKPLVERLAALGYPPHVIETIQNRLDVLSTIRRGSKIPDELKKKIGAQAEAETSALEQLMTILDGRRGH